MEEPSPAQRCDRKRFLVGIDSQAGVGALVKGRATPQLLNKELMKPFCFRRDSFYSSHMQPKATVCGLDVWIQNTGHHVVAWRGWVSGAAEAVCF